MNKVLHHHQFNTKSSLFEIRGNQLKAKGNWWTPLWQGLVRDQTSKHRKAMGVAVWLYLYLLIYTERKTGIVRRTIQKIHQETGYPLRTIYRYLRILSTNKYITILESKPNLIIRIEKWKEFKNYK